CRCERAVRLALARGLRAARPQREPGDAVRASAPLEGARRTSRCGARAVRRRVRARLSLAGAPGLARAGAVRARGRLAAVRFAVPRSLVRGLGDSRCRRGGRPAGAVARGGDLRLPAQAARSDLGGLTPSEDEDSVSGAHQPEARVVTELLDSLEPSLLVVVV